MSDPEPNDLLLFARVVEEGSFSRAAEKLRIPVSTASRRITQLEKSLGERLLLRTTRKLTVTELGLAVAEHARQVLLAAEAAAAVANSRQLKPSGLLRITMASDLGLLASFIAEFLATYPAITVEIDMSVRIVDLIGENFDIALRVGIAPMKDDASVAARPVLQLQAGLYASPTYLKRRGAPRDPEALFNHDAVHGLTRSGEPLRWSLQRAGVRWEGCADGSSYHKFPRAGAAARGRGHGNRSCGPRERGPVCEERPTASRLARVGRSACNALGGFPGAAADARENPRLSRCAEGQVWQLARARTPIARAVRRGFPLWKGLSTAIAFRG